jgi:hypothetical protein
MMRRSTPLDLQAPRPVLDQRFVEPFVFTRSMSRYLLAVALAALVIAATILLVGRYGSRHCWDGKDVLTEKDARDCAR